ncbi:Plasma protease C1 inhibitor [Bagarius yarrelli]|uniref:Plasma protease C1 inhibitor n=1 Tax=Bagarius yarrelli TaxID=175774 RepID=A0A556VW93_BAGYA|nr:Plasma protease C1 inhibitor [Bagarius yarrelli]
MMEKGWMKMKRIFTISVIGSRGETRAELERALFLPADFYCVHTEMKKLTNKMKSSVLVANQMLFRPELQIHEAFINQSQKFYDSVPQKLTNDSAANVKLINDWVASKTQSRITTLVDSVDGSVEFLLLNAVYFIELSGLFSDPNLCGLIEQSGSLPVSDARHCAFLSLTEKGVEAGAASSVSFSRSFSSFNVVRPFILMVFNEEIDSLVFMGRVLHPEK